MTRVEGPLRSFTYAHDAIRTELDELQQATVDVDLDDPDAVANLRERFDFFRTYMGIHDEIEDAGLYPALEEVREGAATVYEWDHERAEEYFEEFDTLLEAAENGKQSISKTELVETITAIRTLIHAHANKEDELLLPLIVENCSVDKQANIAGKAGEVTPDDLTEDVTKFMMKRIDQEGREYMLNVYERSLPENAYRAVIGWTRAVVPDEEWEDLRERVPAAD